VDGGDAKRHEMMFIASLILATQLDACHVLSQKDVAAVQGEAFTGTKLTKRGKSTTCFYQLPLFTNSVSVDLMRSGGREFWEQTFEKEHEHEREEPEESASAPMKVRGVGSEAFWVGGRGTGSLYVRKGDAMVRVSVGGAGTDKDKIEKSKKLAAKALKKL
jgi:hypothetical protein